MQYFLTNFKPEQLENNTENLLRASMNSLAPQLNPSPLLLPERTILQKSFQCLSKRSKYLLDDPSD
jgi:hypothetical protein